MRRMVWRRALVASLLATGAQAGVGVGDVGMDGLARNMVSVSVERGVQDMIEAGLVVRGLVQPRQTSPLVTGNTPLNPDGSIDMQAWNEAVSTACQEALQSLPQASNPSGTCVCYNLPFLNNRTGTFEADLRLYRRNDPTGDFEGIPQSQIEVQLSYNGASVSELKSQERSGPAGGLAARQAGGGDLRLLQSYLFVGQIDKNQMDGEVTMAKLQALVMPTVTLRAVNGDGREVRTNVSSNEAAFVAGAFADEQVMSTFTMAQLSVEESLAGLKNGTVPFVLPGVQILIFPIGLIITSIWLVIGLAAYGFGTYERYQFREMYRQRVAIVEKANVKRF